MARIWQIRQSDEPSPYGMGYKKYETEEETEAYECGYEEGYGDAMEEVSSMGGFRGGMRGGNYRHGGGYREGSGDGMNYRRRRDSRGRYM